MLWDSNGNAFGDVAGSLLCALTCYEAAKASEVNALAIDKRGLDGLHESLNGFLDCDLLNASALGNLVDDVCFCHLC